MVRGSEENEAADEQEINDLRRILTAGIEVEPVRFTSHGNVLTIGDGPLSGITGIQQRIADKQLFVFSVHLIQRSIALNLDEPASLFRFKAASP